MHKASRSALLVISLLASAGLLAAAALLIADPPRPSRESAIEDLTRLITIEWPQASARGDAQWFADHFADELLMTNGQTGELTTKAQTLSSVGTQELVESTSKIEDLRINVYGDVAVTVFQIDFSGTDSTGPWNRFARSTDVWVFRDGRWQLAASHSNPVPELQCCPRFDIPEG